MKIVITGAFGLVGTALARSKSKHELVLIGKEHANLVVPGQLSEILDREKPDAVIHLAAKVGGVKSNTDFVADFYSQNIRMNCNVLDECHDAGVQKVISLLSTCVYPDKATYPLTEDQVHNGRPHKSNFGYAHAKRMLDVHSRSLRQQHGRNYICVIPNNLYGENDFYDLQNSHVIPAITRKMYEAQLHGTDVHLWGSGTALREFTYSGDIARILLFLLENYDGEAPINVGATQETSIEAVAKMIAEFVGFKQEIVWDDSKPSGQYRKPSCNNALLELGWKKESYTSLEHGVQKTCNWFLENYPVIRGS